MAETETTPVMGGLDADSSRSAIMSVLRTEGEFPAPCRSCDDEVGRTVYTLAGKVKSGAITPGQAVTSAKEAGGDIRRHCRGPIPPMGCLAAGQCGYRKP